MADYYESKFTGAEIDNRLESVPNKSDKVQNATAGNIATLKEDGGIRDSGKKLSDFAKVTDLQKKADENHTHDDRYYTESEVNSLLSTKAPSYTYGTSDLTAGSSALETGKLYFVYE